MFNPELVDRFQAVCTQLITSGSDLFRWEWDNRFLAALSTFKQDDVDRVLGILEGRFEKQWTSESALEPAETELVGSCGGLYQGQRLFLSGEARAPVLVAMWWPWGDGTTISLRVRIVVSGLDKETALEYLNPFRSWFGFS